MEGKGGRAYFLGMLTCVQGLQAAEEWVLYCFSGLRAKFANVFLQKLRKNNFNSSVMAGEEPGKMPELYVEALLEEHGLGKRPQAAMRSKSKRVRNLLLA